MLPLLVVLLAGGAVLTVLTAYLMAVTLVRPPRMTDGKALRVLNRVDPGDLGLAFEPVSFVVRDEATGAPLALAAWWVPHPRAHGRCAVLLHGYADAKVGAVAWAPLLHVLEQNVLAVDLRAHGESGGRAQSAGWFERHDVLAVLHQLRAARPADARQVVLMGISLGAATAAATSALPGAGVAGVILESPYIDFPAATAVHGRLAGAPGGVVRWLALRLARLMTGADLGAIRPLDLARTLSCPVLIVCGTDDAFVNPRSLADLGAHVTVVRISGAAHLMGMAADPETYTAALSAFLQDLR